MRKVCILLSCLLFVSASTCFAYEVLLKNGKVLTGKYISEDEEIIVLEDASGVQIRIKKSTIDLTADLNKKNDTQTKVDTKIAATPKSTEDAKEKKKARVYRKEDLEHMPELSRFEAEEKNIKPVESGSEDKPSGEKKDESYWNERALRIDKAMKEARESYEKHKSVCDHVIQDITDVPSGVPIEISSEQFEARRRLSCWALPRYEEQLAQAQDEYESLQEQARREGIPPAWVDADRIPTEKEK